jgi:hypothetical protein
MNIFLKYLATLLQLHWLQSVKWEADCKRIVKHVEETEGTT